MMSSRIRFARAALLPLPAAVLLGGLLGWSCAKTEQPGSVDGPSEAPTSGDRDFAEVEGREIDYEIDGVRLTGYLAYDANRVEPRPGVLVVHEWWGHNDYVRRRADQLAAMGYAAFALDMYGSGKLAEHPEDAQRFMTEIFENLEGAVERFLGAQDLLARQPVTDPERIAAIGYCFGGAVVLHMARIGAELDAVASFHGSLATQTPAQPGRTRARVLVAHGAADPFVSADEIDAFEQEMSAAGVDMRFISYPGAKHSFTNPAATETGLAFDMPLEYDPEADAASWQELERFLASSFSG